MIGMVLVTHGHLATEFRSALEHVVGPQKQLATITIGPEDDMEQRRKDIVDAVVSVESGDGVVVLTDMFGGTPSNLAMTFLEAAIEVLRHEPEPLHFAEIAKRAVQRNLLSHVGRDPEAAMRTCLNSAVGGGQAV